MEENRLDTRKKLEQFQEKSWQQGLVGKEIALANNESAYFPGRSDWVLWRMRQLNYITEQKFEQAQEELKNMTFGEYREEIIAPHFVMWVREMLEERFEEDLVKKGGLKVYTTLDIDTQKNAEDAIAEHIEKNTEQYNAKNAALVSLEPKTGYVRAMAGSADYWNEEIDGKVNVILKKRLPGSSFKPIAFAAAFLSGQLSPASVLFDVETDFGNDWVPQNYDGTFRGPVSIREALGKSLNIPAIKATIIATPQKVYELATRMGISFDFDSEFYGAAIALGGAEARPIDMAVAFSVFANNGKKVEPIGILRIEDRYGNLLYSAENQPEPEEVLEPSVAYLVTDMLSDPNARGEGWNSRLQLSGRQNIAKTGTADKKVEDAPWPADCWTIGGTPQLMTAVWTGNSSGEVLTREASGFTVASPIWQSFMNSALEDVPEERFEIPSGVSRTQVSRLSGKLPLPGTRQNLIVEELFSSKNFPTETDSSLTLIEIDTVSGKLPTEFTPPEAIEEKAVLSMHSYYKDFSDWEYPVQEWLAENKEQLLEKYEITSDILAEMPTKQDDIHTEKTLQDAPKFRFDSPKENDTVAPPRITVIPDISAKNGFQKVIFYWDDRIMKSFDEQQESYIVRIPRSATEKGTLKAEIFDDLYYSDTTEIVLNIGTDTDDPEVEITFPKGNETLRGGTKTTFTVDAIDETGAIQKVEFFLDDERLGSDILYPYEYEWEIPNESEEYTLSVVAFDLAGNTSRKRVDFKARKQAVSRQFGITDPKEGESFLCDETIQIIAGSSSEIREEMKTFEIWAEAPNRLRSPIAQFTEPNLTGFFQTTFTPDNCGEWKFYAKAELKSGSQRVSGKTTVEFEG
jgi:membrane carboxypeptidase/penicillin-binding protein PbpC